jgi:hypothetical protein
MTDYTPGVCNIDLAGQRKRRTFGIIGLVLGGVITGIIFLSNSSVWWMLLAGFLFWMSMLGFVQAKAKFCVANAANNQYETEGKMTKIEDMQAQLLDKKRAFTLHMQAIFIAVLLTTILTIAIMLFR